MSCTSKSQTTEAVAGIGGQNASGVRGGSVACMIWSSVWRACCAARRRKACNPLSRPGLREVGSPRCAENGQNDTWRVARCLGLCVSQNPLETQSWCCELKGGFITPNLVAAWLSSPRLASAEALEDSWRAASLQSTLEC